MKTLSRIMFGLAVLLLLVFHPTAQPNSLVQANDTILSVVPQHNAANIERGPLFLATNQVVLHIVNAKNAIFQFFSDFFSNFFYSFRSSSGPSNGKSGNGGGGGFGRVRPFVGQNMTTVYETSVKSWGGIAVTDKEKEAIREIRTMVANEPLLQSKWLETVTDVEILRFYRKAGSKVGDCWKLLMAHMNWRKSDYGADSTKNDFKNHNLHHEIFWLGEDKTGCPTLVIRTQVHDGIDYNEDPKIFTGFLVQLLEEGKRKYGVGIDKQCCVLMDRGGTVMRTGKKKIERLDFSAIPNLLLLFRDVYSMLMENYPDLLEEARIAPASRFFSMCYKITGRVMDKTSRSKFVMVHEKDLSRTMSRLFNPSDLPPHLGGKSTVYTDVAIVP